MGIGIFKKRNFLKKKSLTVSVFLVGLFTAILLIYSSLLIQTLTSTLCTYTLKHKIQTDSVRNKNKETLRMRGSLV